MAHPLPVVLWTTRFLKRTKIKTKTTKIPTYQTQKQTNKQKQIRMKIKTPNIHITSKKRNKIIKIIWTVVSIKSYVSRRRASLSFLSDFIT